MSIHHLERAALTGMQATKKLVFMAICDDADKLTGVAAPGMAPMHAWSGIASKSRVLAIIAELIDEGYLERVSAGRKGRKAEYRVFARVACCAAHAPTSPTHAPDHSPALGSVSQDPEPVDNSGNGSAVQDPKNATGSAIGSVEGSSLDRTPPVSPVSPVPTYQPHPQSAAARLAMTVGVDEATAEAAIAQVRREDSTIRNPAAVLAHRGRAEVERLAAGYADAQAKEARATAARARQAAEIEEDRRHRAHLARPATKTSADLEATRAAIAAARRDRVAAHPVGGAA